LTHRSAVQSRLAHNILRGDELTMHGSKSARFTALTYIAMQKASSTAGSQTDCEFETLLSEWTLSV